MPNYGLVCACLSCSALISIVFVLAVRPGCTSSTLSYAAQRLPRTRACCPTSLLTVREAFIHTVLCVAVQLLDLCWLQIGECVGTLWRPNFDANLYPYLPAHITKPKEVKRLHIIPLPERCYFAVCTMPSTARCNRSFHSAEYSRHGNNNTITGVYCCLNFLVLKLVIHLCSIHCNM